MSEIVSVFNLKPIIGTDINNDESVAFFTKEKKAGEDLIRTMSLVKDGKIVGEIDGNVVVNIPIDNAEVIRDILKELRKMHLKVNIGVGETAKEATAALDYAIANNLKSIKVYTPELEEEIKSSPEPQSVAESTQDQPLRKDESIHIDENTKNELKEILATIGQNQQLFEQIKQSDPELYAAISEMVSATAEMVQASKDHTEKESNKQIQKIITSLVKEHEKTLDNSEKEVINELMAQQSKRQEQEKEKISKLYPSFKEEYINNNLQPYIPDTNVEPNSNLMPTDEENLPAPYRYHGED